MDNELRVAKPFMTLKELYDSLDHLKPWPNRCKLRECTDYVYTTNDMDKNGGIVQLRKLDRDLQPRTIICHDMKGGYLQDKFVDGSSAHDSYLFYHWSIVDIFIYFSHHLVTIPPYGWIHAAHIHGVKVLGTVITEHTDGEHIWEKVLSTTEETKRFADALILLAHFYNFEGWLLNIENTIKSYNIGRLLYFVEYLTDRIHDEIPGSQIIWYDSVTIDGDLKWQNELNDKNECFLNNCDGIFLNYNWTDSGLENTKILAAANKRINDIYVGLDVWGRGCPGGGGFNSAEALKKIRRHNLSVAVFGPAWTHEYFGGEKFQQIESIFWAQLSSSMFVHVPIYDNEKFVTSFCRGSGRHYYRNGIRDERKVTSFYNLTWQQPQVSVPAIHLIFTHRKIDSAVLNNDSDKTKKSNVYIYEMAFNKIIIQDRIVNLQRKNNKHIDKINHYIDFNTEFSYDGGGCLELVNIDSVSHQYYRLFLVHLEFDSDVEIIIIHQKQERIMNGVIDEDSDVTSESPALILVNGNMEKRYISYDDIRVEGKWRQSNYRIVDMKTIHQIGVAFPSVGRYYIGKIKVQSKSQQYPRLGN